MPTSNSQMIHKLQVALNRNGLKILCNRSQFYSDTAKRPVTMYVVSQAIWNEGRQRWDHEKLFTTASEIQEVLFLRNLWYHLQGKPIPPTNRMKGAAEFERKWQEFYESHQDLTIYLTDHELPDPDDESDE